MKSLLLLLFLSNFLWAVDKANIPDGVWNGKPWKKSQLLAEVKKGTPDALAEWAYCSRLALLRIPYDAKLIYQRAKKAADQGSLLGQRMVAKCLKHGTGVEIDKKASHALTLKLVEQGCPDSMVDLAAHYLYSDAPIKDYEKVEELLKKAAGLGSIYPEAFYTALYARPDYAEFNKRKSAEIQVNHFLKNNNIYAAATLQHSVVYDEPELYKGLVTPEILTKIYKRLNEGIRLNHPEALFRMSWHEIQRGDKNLGITLLIRAANKGHASALRNVRIWLYENLTTVDENGDEQLLVISDRHTAQKAAVFAYEKGDRSRTVSRSYAARISRYGGKGYEVKHQKAIKIFRDLIKGGDCNSHDQLGVHHIQEHEKFKGTQKDSDLGFAHLIYHSKHSTYAAHTLALFHMKEPDSPSYNLPRGIAVCKNTMGRQKEQYLRNMKKWVKEEANLTPQQKEELDQLVIDGFPTADKFRRPAFEVIKKSGDLPADWEFDQRYPKKN